jgi:hypothetical protein
LLLPLFPEPRPPEPEFAELFPPLLPVPVDGAPPPDCEPRPRPAAATLTPPGATPEPPDVQLGPLPAGHPPLTCASTITPEFAVSAVTPAGLVCAPAIAA